MCVPWVTPYADTTFSSADRRGAVALIAAASRCRCAWDAAFWPPFVPRISRVRPALRLLPLPLCIAFSLSAMAEERPEDWRLCPLEDAVPVFPDAPPPIGTSADREDMPTEIGGDALTGIYGEETHLRGNATLQRGDQFLAIGQSRHFPRRMGEDDLIIPLIGFRVLDHAHERRQARTGAEQIEVLAGQQIVQDQRAGRLAADHDRIALLQMLQPGGQRAVLYLDAEEFQVLFVIRAGDTVGAHQWTPLDLQADHHELTVLEAQACIASGLEAEQRIVPMVHTENALYVQVAHAANSSWCRDGRR